MNRADEIRLASSMNQSEDEDNSNKERFISILMDEGNEGSFQPYEPLIRKVPSMMEADKKYYEPMAVSIGPYHKGKPELESMEKLKIPCAQQFSRTVASRLMPSTSNGNQVQSHLKDIKFKAYLMHGELSLPPITIDESTKAKFLNLMAYEILPDTPNDNGVTSYIYFMRALLANDHDVKELRSECILQNFLMSDDQVVDLFKQLCIGKTINLLVYGSIKSQIHKYCQSKMIRMRIWMVEVKRTYFINPWTVIALLAGVLVVATGTIQTIFTVFPPQK
ncbi:hypothetical protein HHK36_020620 [Tetracentron sinense]|uniref:Uncharacterized protein n=1 Tax=Tetracentron sinense TaxID=13715 RepID=A0A835DB75_TETSI|nr:hypothetical protein HHK36_020620 [Tetracentron sinense]